MALEEIEVAVNPPYHHPSEDMMQIIDGAFGEALENTAGIVLHMDAECQTPVV